MQRPSQTIGKIILLPNPIVPSSAEDFVLVTLSPMSCQTDLSQIHIQWVFIFSSHRLEHVGPLMDTSLKGQHTTVLLLSEACRVAWRGDGARGCASQPGTARKGKATVLQTLRHCISNPNLPLCSHERCCKFSFMKIKCNPILMITYLCPLQERSLSKQMCSMSKARNS